MEKMALRYDVSAKSLKKAGETHCGDSVDIIWDDNGGVSLLIVDGLGSGFKASLHATLTSKLIVSMLKRGADLKNVFATAAGNMEINSNRGIDYCAFTIVRANECGIVEAAMLNMPEPLLLRHGNPVKLKYDVTEIDGRKIKTFRHRLRSFDTLAAFSDGVTKAGIGGNLNLGFGEKNVRSYLKAAYKPHISSEKLAALLVSVCDSLYLGEPGDDVSAIVLRARSEKIITRELKRSSG